MNAREKIKELHEIASKEDIEIIDIKGYNIDSMSIQTDSGNCYIGIDGRNMTESEEVVHKAHELGHCMTGSFYNRYSKFDLISKHERRADVWAIKKLVKEDELIDAFEHGIIEIWELAEYFDVTEEFMIKACQYYGYLT